MMNHSTGRGMGVSGARLSWLGALALAASLSGCAKASPELCKRACDHIVPLQQETVREASKIAAHEMEEQLETAEEESKKHLAQLHAEMAIVRPKFEDTPEGKRKNLKPAAYKFLKEVYDQEAKNLAFQRAEAVKREEEMEEKAKKQIDAVRKQSEADMDKLIAAETKKCNDECVATYKEKTAECILGLKAADDIVQCGFHVAAPPDMTGPPRVQ